MVLVISTMLPAGAKAICSNNLPEPSISPLRGEQPEDYFDIQLWTGTGSGQSFSNWSFQPDWLWFKHRNGSSDHAWFDSVRGVNAGISSNSSSAENTAANSTQDLVSFDSDGFTTGTPSQYGSLGSNTHTIVTWGWRGGGTAVSNTDGSITSSVSANTEAGFSVLTYSGTGSNSTIGHGLNSAPEMIIVKKRSLANWTVGHFPEVGNGKYLKLNTTGTTISASNVWNSTSPTASVFSVGTSSATNTSSNYVAYCFHSVLGYSKVGSYTGNGGSDGTYVFTGFRPAWVMSKRISGTGYWNIFDVERDVNDSTGKQLWANDSGSEASSSGNLIDILSNGFKMRGTGSDTNASGSGLYLPCLR